MSAFLFYAKQIYSLLLLLLLLLLVVVVVVVVVYGKNNNKSIQRLALKETEAVQLVDTC